MTIEPKPLSRLPAFAEADEVLVVIETPKGSRNKYAYDDRLEVFELKGVLPEGSSFPYDYGFIPSTRAGMAIRSTFWSLWTHPHFPVVSSGSG